MADASYDFFSPFFRAAIITDPKNRSGTRWPLWVFGSEQESQAKSQQTAANGLGALAFCTDITVKLTLAYIPTISVTLSPPFEDARKFLESTLVEYAKPPGGSLIEVVFGYTNGPDGGALSPPFEGNIVSPPSVSFGVDASITLLAQGTGGFGAARAEVGKIFAKKKRVEMMKDVLSALEIRLDDAGIKDGTDERTALDFEVEAAFPANDTVWFFIVDLAINCGCWVTLTNDGEKPTVKLMSVNDTLSKEPKFKFRLFDFPGGMVDPKNGVFPILGITTPTTSVFLSGASTGLRTASYDSKTREIKFDTIDDTTAAPKRTGDGAVGPTVKDSKGDFHPADVSSPESKKEAIQAFNAAQGTQGVRIEVDTVGIPNLLPGAFIEIFGVAKGRIDQKYIVDEVEHTVGTGGYTTKFRAYANVSPLAAGQLGSLTKAANPNTKTKNEKEPQATSSSTVTIQPKASGV